MDSPRVPHLLHLPHETLDEIASDIHSPTSLLSLAKSSKELADIILPHHLPFRLIRAPLLREDLWEYLARDKLHATNVRSLTILQDVRQVHSPDEYDVPEQLPPLLEHVGESNVEADREARGSHAFSESKTEAMLITALRNMIHLHRFAWYRLSPPAPRGEDDLWSALRTLGTVKELDILDKTSDETLTSHGSKQGIIFSNTFLSLSGFTSFKLHTFALDHLEDEPDVTLLMNMLRHNCPDLEIICLSVQLFRHITTATLTPLLSHVSWPHLRIVRLTRGLGCSVSSLVGFLRTHPGIEELSLGRMLPGRAWDEFGKELHRDEGKEDGTIILPRLRSLECSAAQAAAILTYPKKMLERLVGVEVHDLVTLDDYFDWDDEWEEEHADDTEEDTTELIPSPWKKQFLERLEVCPSITDLGLTFIEDPKQLEVLARVAPQLTILSVKADWPVNVSEWSLFYSLFPSLCRITATHLVNLHPPYLQHNIRENNECIQMLASACLQLKVLDNELFKAVLIRDEKDAEGGKVCWVVRKRDGSEESKIQDGEVVYGL